ncbi:uncharacterized protein LOC120645776 [Panicum virgatum]|uniref:uncharacterized protein LOC120645776 n=1 Tax=Panicum virgatum TaxID=38727 RepID=UPI0019D5F447|nr:uncharacterized protein LOC120645776 [Panicum virgatum]
MASGERESELRERENEGLGAGWVEERCATSMPRTEMVGKELDGRHVAVTDEPRHRCRIRRRAGAPPPPCRRNRRRRRDPRFVQPEDRRLLRLEAQVLHLFLVAHSCLADILAGSQESAFLSKRRNHGSQGILRIHSILLTALHAKQHLVASWERVRHRAAEIAYDLVHRTPELKGVVLQPPSPTKPNNVLPICSSTGWRYRRKNHPRRPQASALAKRYLRRRESLLSSRQSKESANELHAKAATWIADILDESLKAGKPQELHQKGPVQTSGNQGTSKHSSQVGSAQDESKEEPNGRHCF